MKKLYLVIAALFFFIYKADAQECVYTPLLIPASGCSTNYLEYMDDVTSILNEPILTVRVNVHIMQDANGTNSFPNNATAIAFISSLFGTNLSIAPHTLNFTPFGHIEPPTWVINLPNGDPIPVLPETRIRFRLTGVYYRTDQQGWDGNGNFGSTGAAYCFNNYGINKNVDMNIFFRHYTGTGYGQAFGNYLTMNAAWENTDVTNIGNAWLIRGLLGHEVGHCLGLPHTGSWPGGQPCSTLDDVFDDTPHPDNNNWQCDPLVGPQSGCNSTSNNMMGYNACYGYISQKQTAYTRYYTSNFRQNLLDCSNAGANYSIQTNTIWNGAKVYDGNININTNSTLSINCALYMPDNTTITIESGSILNVNGIINNFCNSGWNGSIHVKPGGILNLKNGAEITFIGNGNILIDDDVTIPGLLSIEGTPKVYLDGNNTIIDVHGIVDIKNNSTFSFFHHYNSTYGYIKFSNTSLFPSRNITAGNNSNINFTGISQNKKILQIDQETFYIPNGIVNLTIDKGKVELASGSRLQADDLHTVINFNNAKFTSTTPGVNNSHRGIHLYGQQFVSIKNCVFEYGRYGIFAFQTNFGYSLTIENSIFRNNFYGIRTHDRGLALINCIFINNENGSISGFMSDPSHFDGVIYSGNQFGLSWHSHSNSSLSLNNPYINNNAYFGAYIQSAPLDVVCGTVSFNGKGFLLGKGASLMMDDHPSTNHLPSNVTAIGNDYTIFSSYANYLYLSNGNNDFSPSGLNPQSAIYGSLVLGGQFPLLANNNKWNALGTFNSSDFSLTDPNNNPLSVIDPTPKASISACGQAVPPCLNPPCTYQNALDYCPLCEVINTDDFMNVSLNLATLASLNMLNSTVDSNYRIAIQLFYQILNENIPNPDGNESYLLNLNYIKLQEALGHAFRSHQISCEENNSVICEEVQKVIDIENKFISKAAQQNNYFRKFLYSMDKAQTYRIACRRDLCLSLLNEINSWAEGDDIAEVGSFICAVQLEQNILDGLIDFSLAEEELQLCNSSNPFRITAPDRTKNLSNIKKEMEVSVSPNPVKDIALISSNVETGYIILYNNLGQSVFNSTFNYDTDIDMSKFSKGMYKIKIENLQTLEYKVEKILIQ